MEAAGAGGAVGSAEASHAPAADEAPALSGALHGDLKDVAVGTLHEAGTGAGVIGWATSQWLKTTY